MSGAQKTVVATGASSGLGFEVVKQLLEGSEAYNVILGARSPEKAEAAFDELKYDSAKHTVTVLPLDLQSLRGVQVFAQEALAALGPKKIDYLFLGAGTIDSGEGPGPNGSQWCLGHVVNHLSQHYLLHLIREAVAASESRIVFVSSGSIRSVRNNDPKTMDVDLKANSQAGDYSIYSASKFAGLLGAHYWRRNLPECTVVAVSPGLIPNTGLASQLGISMSMPDAKTVIEGAQNLLRAFTVQDLPADPEQIFLTSWGEWWPKDVYAISLDKNLQDKWCPSLEEIEKSEGLSA